MKKLVAAMAAVALAATPAVSGAKTPHHVPCGKYKPSHTNCGKHKGQGKSHPKR
jgi:hypothetical protein